jgi:hypothetical protein
MEMWRFDALFQHNTNDRKLAALVCELRTHRGSNKVVTVETLIVLYDCIVWRVTASTSGALAATNLTEKFTKFSVSTNET